MQLDIYGNIEKTIISKKKKPKTLFDDYEGFVEKFKPKLTTDECLTPPAVYDVVLNYVSTKCDISNKKILRPFFPNGDYENTIYPKNCVVIDNPPFSIVTKIVCFYIKNNIKFFLFAPHLTLLSPVSFVCTRIVCGARVEYENGAKIPTSFYTNMFGDNSIIGDSEIYNELEKINSNKKNNFPKYKYPTELLTVTKLEYLVKNGISIEFKNSEIYQVSKLDMQKKHKKTIFGNGFLLSEKAAAEKAAAEKAAAKKAAAEKTNYIEFQLSDREKNIIKNLSQNQNINN